LAAARVSTIQLEIACVVKINRDRTANRRA
jgi:hypothetical protein